MIGSGDYDLLISSGEDSRPMNSSGDEFLMNGDDDWSMFQFYII